MPKTMITAVSLVVAMTLGEDANATFKTGNDLWLECATPQSDVNYYTKWGDCLGYILGVVDVIASNPKSCIPPEVTAGEVRDTVIRYLQVNPSVRHYPANVLVTMALGQAFSCR